MTTRTLWRAIGGRNALSRWSVILPLALLIPLRAADLAQWRSGYVAGYLFALVVGMAAVTPCIAVAKAWYLPATARKPRPVAALVTFFVLGAARVAFTAATEQLLGMPPSRPLPGELVNGGLQGMVILAAVAVWVTTQRQSRQVRERLRAVQDSIESARLLCEVRAEEVLRTLLADVARELQDRLRQQQTDTTELNRVAQAMRDVSEDYVRPLSHRLRDHLPLDLPVTANGPKDRRPAPAPRRRVSVRTFTAHLQAPTPWVVAALTLVVGTGSSARVVGPLPAALLVLALGTVMVLGSWAVGWGMRRAQGHTLALPTLLVGGHAVVASIGVIAGAAVLAWVTGQAAWRITTVASFIFMAVLVSLALTSRRFLDQDEQDLATAVTEESLALEKASAHLTRLRAGAASFMHGSVQAELVATALMIQQRRTPEGLEAQELDTVIAAAFARIASQIDLSGRRTAIAASDHVRSQLGFWSQATGLDWRVDPDCWLRFDQRPDLSTALSRVLAEGITNAIRHGDGTATATIEAAGHECIRITLTSPGFMSRSAGEPAEGLHAHGLGLNTIAQLASQWSLTEEHGTVVLRVILGPPVSVAVLDDRESSSPRPRS